MKLFVLLTSIGMTRVIQLPNSFMTAKNRNGYRLLTLSLTNRPKWNLISKHRQVKQNSVAELFPNKVVGQTPLITLMPRSWKIFVSELRIKWNKLKGCRGIKEKAHKNC